MQHIYSDPELILYLYNELDPAGKLEVEIRLANDFALRELCNSLKSTLNLLTENSENPHPTSVELILEYSKSKSSMKKATQI